MCDVSPCLVNSTLGNYWARSFTWHITVVLFKKKLFRGWTVFSGWLVAVAMLLSGPEGKKLFSLWKFFFAYFFGHSIWLRAREHCTGVPWLCECWCIHTWEYFKSPATPFGDVPCGHPHDHPMAIPSVTAPSLAKPWRIEPTLTLSQMLWSHSNMSECVRKNFSQAEKFILHQT